MKCEDIGNISLVEVDEEDVSLISILSRDVDETQVTANRPHRSVHVMC